MSKAGRSLNVGDEALTDYKKGATLVRIIAKQSGAHSQSGVIFQVYPPLEPNSKEAWFDADWFEPAPANLL